MVERGNVGRRCGDSRNLRIVINHSLVNAKIYFLNPTTADDLLAVHVHVSYRSQQPNNDTVTRVLQELQNNNIDISQLVEWKAEHCQRAEPSTEEGSSP